MLLALFAPSVPAQDLYIWQDDNGIRHVSDDPPVGDFDVEIQPAIARPRDPAEMRNVGTETRPEWRFSNRLHGPVTALVELEDADNVVARPALPGLLVLPADGDRTVLIGPRDPARSWRYRIRMTAVPGDPAAEHDDGARYVAPVPPDVPVRIDQGFFGPFSHQTPHSRYAIDLALDEGTPVHAARSGTVMDVEAHFRDAVPERDSGETRANYIRVLHDDGTMAVYAHLEHDGVLVRPGQPVETGQLIGRSGNTGYSTGPHLHFAVQVNRDMQLVSVPFEMVDHAGVRITPVDGGADRR